MPDKSREKYLSKPDCAVGRPGTTSISNLFQKHSIGGFKQKRVISATNGTTSQGIKNFEKYEYKGSEGKSKPRQIKTMDENAPVKLNNPR